MARSQHGIAIGEIADMAVTPWRLCNTVLKESEAGKNKLTDRSPTRILSEEYLDIIEGNVFCEKIF